MMSAVITQFFNMSKTREQKQQIIADIKEKLSQQKSMVFLGFSGVNSDDLFDLRDELKKAGCALLVVKKTLLKKALALLEKSDLIEKMDQIESEMALAFGIENELSPAKVCYNFQRGVDNLKILGGVIGSEIMSPEKVVELAQLPSKQELLARLVNGLQSPVAGLVNALKANLNNLVYILSKIKVNNV